MGEMLRPVVRDDKRESAIAQFSFKLSAPLWNAQKRCLHALCKRRAGMRAFLKWLGIGVGVMVLAVGALITTMWLSEDVRYAVAYELVEHFDLNPPVTSAELDRQIHALRSVELVDANGKTFDWNAQPHAVIWINEWANWCVPCRMEFANMKALRDRVGRNKLRIVLLSAPKFWDADKKLAKELGLPFEMATPQHESAVDAKAIDLGIYPNSSFMRASGEGLLGIRAPRPWDSSEWETIVRRWYEEGLARDKHDGHAN
jgi:thiol-disulfide isomerase/thioredoxin